MADDPKKPYGDDADYADPGLREDGKARYPCDTESHARAAWAYVNQADNAAKYSTEDLAKVKAKIRAALKRYGVEVEASAEPPDPQPEQPQEAPAESGASSSPAPVTAAEAAAAIHAAATKTTTASPAGEDKKEGAASMDTAKLREALGLAPDAHEDEVKAALVTAGLAPPAPPAPTADLSGQQQDQRVAAKAARSGLITIDPEQLAQFQEGMVRAAALTKKLETHTRDTAIDKAIAEGKFTPARREHYEKSWDADPDGTRELIASLAAGLVPVTAMGYSTDVVDDPLWDNEFSKMWPKEASRG